MIECRLHCQTIKILIFLFIFFSGITVDTLKQITRLSGLTGEIKMPANFLTQEEHKLLRSQYSFKEDLKRSRHSVSDSDMAQNMNSKRRKSARTMESFSNEMVSSILGAVKRISSEKVASTQSESAIKENAPCEDSRKTELKKVHLKLLDLEIDYLQKAFLQFAALKTLNVLLTTKGYSEVFLFSQAFNVQCPERERERTEVIKWLMGNVVAKSIQQCKLKSVSSVAEQERAHTILHLNHTKCRLEEMPEVDCPSRKIHFPDTQGLYKRFNKNIVPASQLMMRTESISPISRPSSSLSSSTYYVSKFVQMYSDASNG